MKWIYLWLCCFPLLLKADWDSEDEDLSLYHHVNVISGNLNLLCQDAVVKGAQPLPLIRTYTSAGALERSHGKYSLDLKQVRGPWIMQGGWGWFPHISLYVEPGQQEKDRIVYVPEKNGSILRYVYQGEEGAWTVFKPDYQGGQCTGTLSARKNPQYNILKCNFSKRTATLYLPDGGWRIYRELKDRSYSPDIRTYYWALVSETLPSGHRIHYTYNKRDELYHVGVYNPAGNKVLTSAQLKLIRQEEEPEDTFHYQITTSDGGVVHYRSINYKGWNYLSSINSNCRPEEQIHYQPGRKGIGARLHTFSLGGNLQFLAHYYGPNDRKEAKQWKRGKSTRFETDKVCTLEAPIGLNNEILPLARFTYTPEYTDVRDVDNVLTRYHHDGERLHHIEYFDAQDQLQSHLQLFWDGSLLIGKALRDKDNKALFSRTFSYDEKGNVLEETFWGNLTGSVSGPFAIDAQGQMPTAESYRKRYQYDSHFNVPIFEEEEEGLTYRYDYLPGTDLVAAKMICQHDQIVMRQFFFYDTDHLLIAEMIDDGVDSNHSSLNGMTERRIKRYERHPQTGLVLATVELYWDKETGQEILIQRSEYRYSPQNQIIEEAVFDATGTYRYTLYTSYDAYGHIIRKTTPLGQENTYRYDSNGYLLESKEHGAPKKVYTVNLSGKPTTCREIDDDGNCRTTFSDYDAKGRLLSQTDTRGNTTRQSYDAFGKCLITQFPDIEEESGKKLSPQVHFTYDEFGNVASLITPEGAETQTIYNALRKPICIIQADGSQIRHIYTKQGVLAQTIYPDHTRAVFTYDLFQRMTSKKTYAADDTLLAEEYWEYNTFHLISYIDPRGLKTTYTYDGAGRKIGEVAGTRLKTFTYDPLGFLEVTTAGPIKHIQIHDIEGRVIQQWTEDNQGICENRMQFFYDNNNRKEKALRITAQGEAVDLFAHDGEGRLIRHVDPLGAVSRWEYKETQNAIGQCVLQKTFIDPLGNQTIETYDALSHLSQIEKTNPEGQTVAKDCFYYNASGNRIKRISTIYQGQTPFKTIATIWEYDAMGRVIKEVEANQRTHRFQYDSRGRIRERTLPGGIVLTYTYDGIDRLIELKSSDHTIDYQYHYQSGPDPTIIIDHIHHFRIQRDYNEFGELINEVTPHNLEYSWNYDLYGRCASFILPNRSSIVYSYSGAHLTSVAKHSAEGTLLYQHRYTQFDPNGHVQQELLIDQVSHLTTQRDLLERPILQSSSHLSLTTAYGPSGLVIENTNSLFGTKDYVYDPLNQLTQEGEKAYSFDSFGNPTDCEVNDCNQILSTQDTSLDYDGDGNPTRRISPQGQIEYSYDALGRLITLRTPKKAIYYRYDPFSRLLSKEVFPYQGNSDKILYLYDQEHEIGTATEDGVILQLKVLGLGLQGDIGAAVAIELASSVFAPLHDFNGNLIALLSLQGKLVEAYDIDAFGKESTPFCLSPWRFCSKRCEEGLIFFGKRFYDPTLGRWLTPDPAGSIDTPNLYLYVRNSPLNRLDLFGLYSAPQIPWSNKGEGRDVVVELSIPQVESLLKNGIANCKGTIGGVEVDIVVLCGHMHKLQYSAEEMEAGKVNIFDHLHELVPKEGGVIGLFTFQNGINVKQSEFEKMGKAIGQHIPEGTLGIGLYNPTEGVFSDICRVFKEFKGIETPTVDRTRQMMNALIDILPEINPDILWAHTCHSEAGLIAKNSISGMTDDRRQKMRKHMICIALGPASPLSKADTLDALNYYSDKDRVTKRFGLDHVNDLNYDIQIVKSVTPSKDLDFVAGDHGFDKATYQGVLKGEISKLRERYGFYETR